MYLRAASLLNKHSDNASTRVLVLTGTGRVFCAGMDLKEASQHGDGQGSHLTGFLQAARSFMGALMTCNRIIVAGVFGSVTGIGVTLLTHCDIVLTHMDATFQTAFPSVGMVPEFASSFTFPLFFGFNLSSRLLLRNDTVSANDLQHAGCAEILDVTTYADIQAATVEHAMTWSERLNDEQFQSVIEAKYLIRKPIREKANEVIVSEFKAIDKMNEDGSLLRLIRAKYSQIQSQRRAML